VVLQDVLVQEDVHFQGVESVRVVVENREHDHRDAQDPVNEGCHRPVEFFDPRQGGHVACELTQYVECQHFVDVLLREPVRDLQNRNDDDAGSCELGSVQIVEENCAHGLPLLRTLVLVKPFCFQHNTACDDPRDAEQHLGAYVDPLWLRHVIHNVAEDDKAEQKGHLKKDLAVLVRYRCVVDSHAALNEADGVQLYDVHQQREDLTAAPSKFFPLLLLLLFRCQLLSRVLVGQVVTVSLRPNLFASPRFLSP